MARSRRNVNMQAEIKSFRSELVQEELSKVDNEYMNRFLIDRYLDSYWLINCPAEYSLGTVDNEVRKLLRDMMNRGRDYLLLNDKK